MSAALETQLLATAGFRSLNSERQLLALVRSLNWEAVHSFYYADAVTGKPRELDILAHKSYSILEKKINPLVRVRLLLECKTIENYNLVFSLEDPSAFHPVGYFDWIGHEETRDKMVVKADEIMTPELVSMLLKEFDSIAYPQERFLAAPIMVDPPEVKLIATAFRELTPKSEREIDASVLWKSIQSLSSARTSMQTFAIEDMFEWMLPSRRGVGYRDERTAIQGVLSWCSIMLTTVNIYHPIVVVECPMYGWDGNELSTLNHVRLVTEMQGGQSNWYDILQIQGIRQFLDELTSHYNKLVPEGLERLRPYLNVKRQRRRRPRT